VPGTTNGGLLATAGGLVFQSTGRVFHVLDAQTGKKLVEVPIKVSTSSSPFAFQAGGKELVAIASGSSIVAIGLP
jgi:alcohol dehydrogenase (cytochrome c)/quinohemoprotein ethanol dehydrogenase